MKTKQCKSCNSCKPLESFSDDNRYKGGISPYCNICEISLKEERAIKKQAKKYRTSGTYKKITDEDRSFHNINENAIYC